MKNKYKSAGIWNIVCAALFAISYVLCTYVLKNKYDIEGGYLVLWLFLLLAFFSYVAVPFLFIGLILLAIMVEISLAPYAPWLIAASMLVTGIWLLFKRKQGLGTKILLAVSLGFKGNGNLLIGFYAIEILFSLSLETLWIGICAWGTMAIAFVSIVKDYKLIVRKRNKGKNSAEEIS